MHLQLPRRRDLEVAPTALVRLPVLLAQVQVLIGGRNRCQTCCSPRLAGRVHPAGMSEEDVARSKEREFPLGRWGRPGDIAYWVLAFADNETEWVTGQMVSVDGGAGLTW